MEVSTRPRLFTSKNDAFPLELPRSPLCPRPRSGLFQFALRLEDDSENVHEDERVGMARAQLRFTPRECFALQLFSLAAGAGAVRHYKRATQMSAICVISAACKLPCILHININRTAFVGCQLQQGN